MNVARCTVEMTANSICPFELFRSRRREIFLETLSVLGNEHI